MSLFISHSKSRFTNLCLFTNRFTNGKKGFTIDEDSWWTRKMSNDRSGKFLVLNLSSQTTFKLRHSKKQRSPNPLWATGGKSVIPTVSMHTFAPVRETEMTFLRLGESEASWENWNSHTMLSTWELREATRCWESHFYFSHCGKVLNRTCSDDLCPLLAWCHPLLV